jgi:hypothetical protein
MVEGQQEKIAFYSIKRKAIIMGWSSGSRLMSEIIKAAQCIESKEVRKTFFVKCIDAFEDQDWDDQDACIGEDKAFDEALQELHPHWVLYRY